MAIHQQTAHNTTGIKDRCVFEEEHLQHTQTHTIHKRMLQEGTQEDGLNGENELMVMTVTMMLVLELQHFSLTSPSLLNGTIQRTESSETLGHEELFEAIKSAKHHTPRL